MSLTPKQERFVAEYLVDLNATAAAERAGYEHPNKQGPRMLVNVGIAKAIASAQARRSERTEVTQDYVLAAIKDTIERCKQAVPVKYQNGNPVMVETPGGDLAPAYKFEANAVLKGAELLGRHLAMFTDKAVVDLNHGLQEMTDGELEAHARRLAEKVGGTLPLRLITPTDGKVR